MLYLLSVYFDDIDIISAALQSLKAVTAYFSSKQLLPFGFARMRACAIWRGSMLSCIILFSRPFSAADDQITRCADPMLVKCWGSFADGVLTLRQNWPSVSCRQTIFVDRSKYSTEEWKQMLIWGTMRCSPNVGLILDQRCRGWANIKATLL